MVVWKEWFLNYLLSTVHTITNPSTPTVKKGKPSIEDWVRSRGYPIETHSVTSQDGYILVLHRIKYGKRNKNAKTKKPPILIQHGMSDSSPVFLSRSKDMGYYLADAGYDVWLGNMRGNYFSGKHQSTDSKTNSTYWEFSFHEMGMFDLPAMLNHIKAQTEGSKIHYVGISMGSTMFLVMGAMKPELLDLVDCVILIAPVARPQHLELISTTQKRKRLRTVFKTLSIFGKHESYWLGEYYLPVLRYFCGLHCYFCFVCDLKTKLGLTKEKDLYRFKNKINAYRFSTAGVNFKSVEHFMQMSETAKFQQFDYGGMKPAEYDLTKITKRVYIFAGGQDTMAEAQDVQWLSEHLSNCLVIKEVFKDFDHEYFTFGNDLGDTLYKTINKVIKTRPKTEAEALA